MAVALAAACVLTLCWGTPRISPSDLGGIWNRPDSLEFIVLWELRLPRLLLGILAGASLAAAGVLLQEALRNPLAVPELLGVAPGAALVVAVIVVWHLPVPLAVQPLLALGGGLCGGAAAVAASARSRTATGVLLAGAAVSAAVGALVVSVVAMAEQLEIRSLFRYLSGSLADVTWQQVGPVAVWLLCALALTPLCIPALGVLRLGDDAASALGVHVGRIRLVVLVVATLLVAAPVSVCGPIAWIGFIGPQVARRLFPGSSARMWLPVAMLAGATLTAAADLAARHAFAPIETPVGGWTSAAAIVVGALLLRDPHPARRA